jgi:methylphosphotriester-DNA--protein-cysteine methyltransferase
MTAKEAMQDGYVPCTRCLRQYLKTGLSGHSALQVADTGSSEEEEEEQREVLSAAGH